MEFQADADNDGSEIGAFYVRAGQDQLHLKGFVIPIDLRKTKAGDVFSVDGAVIGLEHLAIEGTQSADDTPLGASDDTVLRGLESGTLFGGIGDDFFCWGGAGQTG